MATMAERKTAGERGRREIGQVVLVFQGGGALGAYQAGVYQALHERGVEPDWIIGTSIGAINASLIAGNAPDRRLPALLEFWHRVSHRTVWNPWTAIPQLRQSLDYWMTVGSGIPGFFEPNPAAFLGAHVPLGVERAGFYSIEPLRRTLCELVDFDLVNAGHPRLTVGAAHVRSSRMHYFDSSRDRLDERHVMASGALPPAFPAVRVDGELYWDGGVLSNTPSEVIFEDNPRRDSLIFAVHVWSPDGDEPGTISEVMHRQKDIQYSSRVATHIARQKQIHRLRHIIQALSAHLPEAERRKPAVADMVSYGCLTRMHVVRLLAPRLDDEDLNKDVDFSPLGVRRRWQAGYENARLALDRAPWTRGPIDPLDGVILHEPPFSAAPAAVTVP